jgi:hypothetical protein
MKKVLLSMALVLSLGIVTAQTKTPAKPKAKSSGPNYKSMALNYVSSKLRSPGSASLVQYDGPNDTKSMLINAGFKLDECVKVTRVVVDSQNGFGALLRGYFFVFFKNGTPCHMEDANSLGSSSYGYMDKTMLLNTTLQMNQCDCK